jgi:NaMN:DMB phosphoribosyltransferase
MLGCAHEQKAHCLQWAESIGVANTNTAFVMLVGLATRFEAEWSQFFVKFD